VLGVIRGGGTNLLSIRETAEVLGLSTRAVYVLCERGELCHARILNTIRIDPRDLDAFIAARK
jgi:excisionase family DNA binding protein